jgi:hypothetical protein
VNPRKNPKIADRGRETSHFKLTSQVHQSDWQVHSPSLGIPFISDVKLLHINNIYGLALGGIRIAIETPGR